MLAVVLTLVPETHVQSQVMTVFAMWLTHGATGVVQGAEAAGGLRGDGDDVGFSLFNLLCEGEGAVAGQGLRVGGVQFASVMLAPEGRP